MIRLLIRAPLVPSSVVDLVQVINSDKVCVKKSTFRFDRAVSNFATDDAPGSLLDCESLTGDTFCPSMMS